MRFSEWLELREVKDACYRKVKARFNVFPSAYSSGALVQCRKKGAKNWGKKRESVEYLEALRDSKQYSDAANAAMLLHYKGIDAATAPSGEIAEALEGMGRRPPEDTSMELFVARIRAVARETVLPDDFKESTFKLEKDKGLHGWFRRNHGKGWIDCKQSTKDKKVPCGRKKAGRGADREYPACRPTLSACNNVGEKKKKDSRRVSWED
jgi:hypothetical protein